MKIEKVQLATRVSPPTLEMLRDASQRTALSIAVLVDMAIRTGLPHVEQKLKELNRTVAA